MTARNRKLKAEGDQLHTAVRAVLLEHADYIRIHPFARQLTANEEAPVLRRGDSGRSNQMPLLRQLFDGSATLHSRCDRCRLPEVQYDHGADASQAVRKRSGCIGAILFVVGVICCFTIVGIVPGLVLVVLSLLLGALAGKVTVMTCPACRYRGNRLT